MDALLELGDDFDVGVLDQVVAEFYGGGSSAEICKGVLEQLQQHPAAWTKVDAILELSKSQATKFFALSILENLIRYRWKALPREQCDGIKNFVVNLVIKLSMDDETMAREEMYLRKLDVILVQVLKQEWPRNWQSFIPEIVGSSKTNECICENNLFILKLLSEDVFDFSRSEMTSKKARELKSSFTTEFQLIFELCEFVLSNSAKESLLKMTLKTLLRFLGWIPIGFIFETTLIETLVVKFFPTAVFQNLTLKCLTEIVALEVASEYDSVFQNLFVTMMGHLTNIIPVDADLGVIYVDGTSEQQNFIQNLALFLSTFFMKHLKLVEESQEPLMVGHYYLTAISYVPDVEVWKIVLEYWSMLAMNLYHITPTPSQPLLLGSFGALSSSGGGGRRELYAHVLSRVRHAIISRMPKPEEVLIVEDDNGEIVREFIKDNEAIILYNNMRETLVYLTNLDSQDTKNIMLEKLVKQVDGSEWSWNNLNTLCWAIGSISGAQSEEEEKRFLVLVIKDLLHLCDMKTGKDNKAVIASNIMYIVGQYPRFLRAHWRFLKTVINKLFEFMHERHPGVQDMACETFLKISQKCRRKFVTVQASEHAPFVEEILATIHVVISDLEPSQIQTFYEGVATMIRSHPDPLMRKALAERLMALPNEMWVQIMAEARRDIDYLKRIDTSKAIVNILRTNVRAAMALGHDYIHQLGLLFIDLLNVYKVYSANISHLISTGGPHAARTAIVRSERSVKTETLRILSVFIEKSEDPHVVTESFIPPLLEHVQAVLIDYKENTPESRDPEVLSLITAIIKKFRDGMIEQISPILGAVFEATLSMITANFEDFPTMRVNFFELLRAINSHCFPAFFSLPAETFKLIIDSIVWAFKHTMRNIAETGLRILLEMMNHISLSSKEIANEFYSAYFLSILQDIFYVLTDTMHKPGFGLQATILHHLIVLAESGHVLTPLWNTQEIPAGSGMNNQVFLREYTTNLLGSAFEHLTADQVRAFVVGLFELSSNLTAFKNHLRDFLVQLKEFGGEEEGNEELFLEEREEAAKLQKEEETMKDLGVPGLVPVYDARRPENREDAML